MRKFTLFLIPIALVLGLFVGQSLEATSAEAGAAPSITDNRANVRAAIDALLGNNPSGGLNYSTQSPTFKRAYLRTVLGSYAPGALPGYEESMATEPTSFEGAIISGVGNALLQLNAP